MAKTSVTQRNNKRIKISENLERRTMRDSLRETIKKDPENRAEAIVKLQKRKRNESQSRVRNRCLQCGRPRGVMRKFGLCRICIRKFAMLGYIPGLRKSSW